MLGVLKKIAKVLGKITDVLLIGRQQGWWSEKHGLPRKPRRK